MTNATTSPLAALSAKGVSVWLDDLSRDRIQSGRLQNLIDTHSVVGVTTNPTIFAAALASGKTYAAQIAELVRAGYSESDVERAVFEITTDDVAAAADIFAPVAARTNGEDGKVSIEVEPALARDTEGTIAMATTLWNKVARDNVHIKIPATVEGVPAIEGAIAEGVSVNVTLLFDLDRYRAVAEAYLAGLERARDSGRDLSTIHSVASVFISRIDSEVDERLSSIGTDEALALRGQAALAVGRACYGIAEQVFSGPRWEVLAAAGAHPQRALWASTATRDERYPDTKYLSGLVARNSVNTMTEQTLLAFEDHGAVGGPFTDGAAADGDYDNEARAVLAALEAVGVSYDEVSAKLEDEALGRFEASWNELLATVRNALASADV